MSLSPEGGAVLLMAEPTQYSFEINEVVVALIKHQGLHEGLWTLNFEFTIGAGRFGPTAEDSKPGAFMQIQKFQLTRLSEGTPEASLGVDAATVNPSRKKG